MAHGTVHVLLSFVLLLSICRWVQPEVFTSTAHIESLLHTQERFIVDVHEYIALEEKRLETIKKYLNKYKEEALKIKEVFDVGNPITAFTILKRLKVDVDFIRNLTQIDNSFNVTKNHHDLRYPTSEDLIGAAQGISRLQDTYSIDTKELSEGVLKGVVYSNPMTASDCFELGRALVDVGDYEIALPWLEAARRKYRNEIGPQHFNEADIVEYAIRTHLNLGDAKTACKLTEKMVEINPTHQRADFISECPKFLADEEETKVNAQNMKTEGVPKSPKRPFCQDEMDRPPAITKSLYCQYLTKNHPFLKIAPFKVEIMNLQPEILVFHDVMSDAEMEFIMEMAKPKLERSRVHVAANNMSSSSGRISKAMWIQDNETLVVARVSRRVSHMTGLSMDTSEDLQVANYGIGGHYDLHQDFFQHGTASSFKYKDKVAGNRIATVLFYLTDVAEGGATLFPMLRVRLLPRKGTAVVWYNLLPTGEGDNATRHAACPVLLGSKWVATKWVREIGQEFLRPCDSKYQSNPNPDTETMPLGWHNWSLELFAAFAIFFKLALPTVSST